MLRNFIPDNALYLTSGANPFLDGKIQIRDLLSRSKFLSVQVSELFSAEGNATTKVVCLVKT